MKQWYVVHTHVNKESYAAQQLKRQDFEVYLPKYHKTRRHARKTEIVLAPLFPRYLFIQIDVSTDKWRSVASTYGVDYLVSAGNEPLSISNDIIDAIKNSANDSGIIDLPTQLHQPGDIVTVREGAFEGYKAIFECQDDNQRATVLLTLLNREVRVKTAVGTLDIE